VTPQMQAHLFWGKHSPLSSFTGIGLLVLASSRVDSALICILALLWTGFATMLSMGLGRAVLPEKGRAAVQVFAASFNALLFYFALSLINPLAALEDALFILLCPVFLVSSGLYDRVKDYDTSEMVSQASAEAMVMGLLVLALALIREPLGYGSLSLPGMGIARFAQDPAAVFKFSSGAFILLGYGTVLYRWRKKDFTRSEED